MNIFGKTDIGLKRESNQDAFSFGKLSDRALWAVVCDGMGGANGGNVASEMAVQSVAEQMNQSLRVGMDDPAVQRLLSGAIENANRAIYRRAQLDPALSGMGTTIVLAVWLDGKIYVAHVGDSRAYLISRDGCTQVTTDHSIVQMMVDRGELTEAEAKIHPNKNVITRALGIDDEVEIDYEGFRYTENEILLLCSDGLTNFVETGEIQVLVLENEVGRIPEVLVERANRNGGGDNITAVVIGQV